MFESQKSKNFLSDQTLAWRMIVTTSQQLVQLAEQKNWSRLSRLQQERDQLIQQFFSLQPPPELMLEIREDIKKICDQDRKIIQTVSDNRGQLGVEAQRLLAMKNRIQQYLSTEKS